MLSRITRLFRKAAQAPSPGLAVYAASTVRDFELNTWSTRGGARYQGELVARFLGTVKVAASRNAMQVASTPLRVYASKGRASSEKFAVRRMKSRELAKLRKRAGLIARKSLEESDDFEEITDPVHPYKSLLEKANPRENGYSLIENLTLWMGLAGNGYWLMPGKSGPPTELWNLPPMLVHPVPDKQRIVGSYIYGRGFENEQTFPAERVCQFRNPNPSGSPYFGKGDLEACVEEADLGRGFAQFALATLYNGAQPGMVFSSENWATMEQAKAARDQFEAEHVGKFKAGRSLFLNGKVNVTPWTMGDKEMAFLASSERVDQVIAACFDMPVSLLRLDTAALATAKTSIQHWQKMAIAPRCRRIEDQINQDVSPLFGEGVFVAFDEAVDDDNANVVDQVAKLWGEDLLTKNQALIELGYEPIDDGDKYKSELVLVGANPVPALGEDGKPAEVSNNPDSSATTDAAAAQGVVQDTALNGAQVTALQGMLQSVALGQLPLETARATIAAAFPALTPEQIDAMVNPLQGFEPTKDEPNADPNAGPQGAEGDGAANADGASGGPDDGEDEGGDSGAAKSSSVRLVRRGEPQREAGRKHRDQGQVKASDLLWSDAPHTCCTAPPRTVRKDRLNDRVSASEMQLQAALASWFDGRTAEIVDAVDSGVAVDVAGEKIRESLFARIAPILQSLYMAGAARGAGEVADSETMMRALTAGATDWLRQYGGKLVRSVTDTLDQRIRGALAEGIAAGDGSDGLKARVREVMRSASENTAELIARTESARAYLAAREEAWKASGQVTGKKWLLAADPCEFCQAMASRFNEKAVPLGVPFLKMGDTLTGANGGSMLIDYSAVEQPPLHPRCQCDIVAEFKE